MSRTASWNRISIRIGRLYGKLFFGGAWNRIAYATLCGYYSSGDPQFQIMVFHYFGIDFEFQQFEQALSNAAPSNRY